LWIIIPWFIKIPWKVTVYFLKNFWVTMEFSAFVYCKSMPSFSSSWPGTILTTLWEKICLPRTGITSKSTNRKTWNTFHFMRWCIPIIFGCLAVFPLLNPTLFISIAGLFLVSYCRSFFRG